MWFLWNAPVIMAGAGFLLLLTAQAERFQRFLYRARPIKTERDTLLVNCAYMNALEKLDLQQSRFKKLRTYIVQSSEVNAFALGSRTIAVTRGSMMFFSEEELSAVIGHEVGHVLLGHSFYKLILTSISLYFTLFFRLLDGIIGWLYRVASLLGLIGFVARLLAFFLTVVRRVISFVGDLIILPVERKQELEADAFVFNNCKLGRELIESLYKMAQFSFEEKIQLTKISNFSHPHFNDRIARLERMIDSDPMADKVERNIVAKFDVRDYDEQMTMSSEEKQLQRRLAELQRRQRAEFRNRG